MSTNATGTLKSSPLFKGWSEKDLETLAGLSSYKDLGPGEVIFYEGEDSTALFLVAKGTIAIKKASKKGGDDESVTKIGAGSHLGEMAMLNLDGTTDKRSATAETAEMSDVVEVPYKALFTVIESSPAAGLQFYKNLAITLAGRIRRTTEDLTGLRSLRLRNT